MPPCPAIPPPSVGSLVVITSISADDDNVWWITVRLDRGEDLWPIFFRMQVAEVYAEQLHGRLVRRDIVEPRRAPWP